MAGRHWQFLIHLSIQSSVSHGWINFIFWVVIRDFPERKTERERQRDRETKRQRETDRQKTEKETETETETERRDRDRERELIKNG